MNKKTILGTVSVIVLGALGSALWDFSKPMLTWLVTTVAELSTLGIDSLRDAFYVKAARTLGRPIGIGLSTALIVSFIALATSIVCRILSYSADQFRARSAKAMSHVFFLTCVIFLIQIAGIAYSMTLANDYQALEIQAAPHLSDSELKSIRAKFSRVTTKDEYGEVIDLLTSKLQSTGASAPVGGSRMK